MRIYAENVRGRGSVGILVGYAYDSQVENIACYGSVSGNDHHVGGVIGLSILSNSHDIYFEGSVHSSGESTGGLIGTFNRGNLEKSEARGTVTGGINVGGLVGNLRADINGTVILNSNINRANIVGEKYVGGIAGAISGGDKSSIQIEQVANAGSIFGVEEVGGIIGSAMRSMSNISATYNTGTVQSDSGRHIGGLMGSTSSIVGQESVYTHSYNVGLVEAKGYYVAELIGYNQQFLSNSYGLTDRLKLVAGSYDGTDIEALTPEEMLNFAGNIKEPFIIDENKLNNGFPILRGIDYNRNIYVNEDFLEGEGTPEAPYIIRKPSDLQAINEALSAHYILGNDIVFGEGERECKPIGSSSSPFTGVFNGDNFTISGLRISDMQTDNVGIFAVANRAVFKNIGMRDISVLGRDKVGTLVGEARQTNIDNCVLENIVVSGREDVGGLVGEMAGNVNQVAISGYIKGAKHVGGLVGHMALSSDIQYMVQDSYMYGKVEGQEKVGGIVGYNFNNETKHAYFLGEIIGNSGEVYGIAGNSHADNHSFYNLEQVTDAVDTWSGRTSAQLLNKETFKNWDFENIWKLGENNYPYLISLEEISITDIPTGEDGGIEMTGHLVYTYNSVGRLTTLTNDQGDKISFTYDASGNILSVEVQKKAGK